MKYGLIGVLACLAATTGLAQPRIDTARLSQDIKVLASDAYEGRGPATRAETKTIAYLEAQMKAAGLEPAGEIGRTGKRGWTQAVPLLRSEYESDPKVVLHTARGPIALAQRAQLAAMPPRNGQAHVSLAGAPLLFVGYGVTAPERKWDDYKVDVRGKILVVLVNDPDFESGSGDFEGKAMTYYGRWIYKYEEAARHGAAGVLIVHENAAATYGWATVSNSFTIVQFDIVRDRPGAVHTPLEAWIQRDVAVDLFKAAGLDFEEAKRKAQSRDFQPIPLQATLDATLDANVTRIVSHNVAGRIAGSRHPQETIAYTAHWDHLGIGTPDPRGDRIYNGAQDNATGTAALLSLARAWGKAPRPDRSVLFLSVTAEEKGLLGSEYYGQHPLYPLATTVGVLNMDGINLVGPTRNFFISGSARLGLLDDLIEAGRKVGRTFTPEPHPEAGGFFRSDHFPFARQGVPAISFVNGNDLIDGGVERGEALEADYISKRYHQPGDEWRADWNMKGAAQDLDLLFTLGQRLANSREWPNWSKDSEFRATRDASAALRRP